jgi:hypothetical protein
MLDGYFPDGPSKHGRSVLSDTYGLRLYAAMLGVYVFFRMLVWDLPKELVLFFWYGVPALVKIVHSDKRLLSGVDGSLGGAVGYLFFAHDGMTATDAVLAVLAGFLFGAVFGLLSWTYVTRNSGQAVPTGE